MTARAFRFINDGLTSRFGHSSAGTLGQVLYVVAAMIIVILVMEAFYSANLAAGLIGLLVLAVGVATLEWFAMDRERT